MAHGDAREGKWRGNWRMKWVASTLRTASEHGVSSITTADAHPSAAISWLNWRPRRFKWTRPFRRKTKSGFCACAITFQTQFNTKQFAVLPSGQNFVSSDGCIRCRILPTSNVTFCTCSFLRIWSVIWPGCRTWLVYCFITYSKFPMLPVAEDGKRTRKRGSCGCFVSVPCVRINILKE